MGDAVFADPAWQDATPGDWIKGAWDWVPAEAPAAASAARPEAGGDKAVVSTAPLSEQQSNAPDAGVKSSKTDVQDQNNGSADARNVDAGAAVWLGTSGVDAQARRGLALAGAVGLAWLAGPSVELAPETPKDRARREARGG